MHDEDEAERRTNTVWLAECALLDPLDGVLTTAEWHDLYVVLRRAGSPGSVERLAAARLWVLQRQGGGTT